MSEEIEKFSIKKRELVKNREQGNCNDIPMREALKDACDYIDGLLAEVWFLKSILKIKNREIKHLLLSKEQK